MNQSELDPEKKASPPPDRPFEWLRFKDEPQIKTEFPNFLRKWRIGTLSAILIACAFIVPTWSVYDQTPSNAYKGVGYIFITLYGIIVGAAGGLSVSFIQKAIRQRAQPIKSIV